MPYFALPGFDGIEVYTPSSWQPEATFALNLRQELERIRRLPTGSRLLRRIRDSRPAARRPAGRTSSEAQLLRFEYETKVLIMPLEVQYMQSGYMMFGGAIPSASSDHNPSGSPFYRRGQSTATTEPLDRASAERRGMGSKSLIKFSNAITGYQLNTPAFIILAHELIHAYHHLYGLCKNEQGYQGGAGDEELFTVGAGPWGGGREPEICENKLRREAGLPIRQAYTR